MAIMEPLEVVQEAYAAFGRRDIAALLALTSEDIEWNSPGAGAIPFGGTYHGHAGVVEFFTILSQTQDITSFEPTLFAQGETVVALIHSASTIKSTGKQSEGVEVHVFTVRNGKVVRFDEYYDTVLAAEKYT